MSSIWPLARQHGHQSPRTCACVKGHIRTPYPVPRTPRPVLRPSPPATNWGTQLKPQHTIDSGDPALVVIGQQKREQMQPNGQVDTSGKA